MSTPAARLRPADPPAPRPPEREAWPIVVLVSLLAHVVLVPLMGRYLTLSALPMPEGAPPVGVAVVDDASLDPRALPPAEAEGVEVPADPEPVEPEPLAPPPPIRRQIVETAPPEVEKAPEQAEYLAEHDNTVEQETRSDRFKINPDVLAAMFSEESRKLKQEAQEAGVPNAAERAIAGRDPDPFSMRLGPPRTSIPSKFALPSDYGASASMRAFDGDGGLAGAPQNDLLDEAPGVEVALNTLAYAGAKYLNDIRRHVNFYWSQNLDNVPRNLSIAADAYKTVVQVELDRTGAVQRVVVVRGSGSSVLDRAAARSFELAGPFPNPPAELVKPDGRVELPQFAFTVRVGGSPGW